MSHKILKIPTTFMMSTTHDELMWSLMINDVAKRCFPSIFVSLEQNIVDRSKKVYDYWGVEHQIVWTVIIAKTPMKPCIMTLNQQNNPTKDYHSEKLPGASLASRLIGSGAVAGGARGGQWPLLKKICRIISMLVGNF